jgi:predicted phosphodiesterase
MRILLIADIHGNFPALTAVAAHAANHGGGEAMATIVNCGDSVVYAPFANETMDWLRQRQTLSILGNTDRGVLKLLRGKNLKKPRHPDKRQMYESTAKSLSVENAALLQSFAESAVLPLPDGVFLENRKAVRRTAMLVCHGSPDDPDEFLFDDTAGKRFKALAQAHPYAVIVCGHSHTPFWKIIGGCHFINPGSVGRMFDGNPAASYAILDLLPGAVNVRFFRVGYDLAWLTTTIRAEKLPEIYVTMYETGRKLN